ncbi:hypothetical protein JCM8547_003829 [Rhodosporidiobolus lusitaniae]
MADESQYNKVDEIKPVSPRVSFKPVDGRLEAGDRAEAMTAMAVQQASKTGGRGWQSAHETITAAFMSGKTRDVEWRKQQVRQLGLLLQDNTSLFVEALQADLSRPGFETITGELEPVKNEVNEVLAHLDSWAKPKRVKTSAAWWATKPTVHSVPKGPVLVIGTWNYPITLLITPLLGAISAGCTAIVKPAEQAPVTAALIAGLIPQYLDPQAYIVIQGAVEQTTALLELKFSHIFYTGSGKVGRIVAKAAAEHLCPTTLELGGKSPAVVLDDADIEVVARRLAWAKYINAGQICIAPDYVLTTPAIEPKLIAALKRQIASFSKPPSSKPSSAASSSSSSSSDSVSLLENHAYCRIITPAHFSRLSNLLAKTKGEIVIGGGKSEGKTAEETRKIEITVVRDVREDDALMQEEIFGPILPIVTVADEEKMLDIINKNEVPLALYLFTQSKKRTDYFFNSTRSGTFLQNDLVVQFLVPGLPFGGTGESGYGNYHGKKSFNTFSHERPAAHVPTWMDSVLASRYPPYSSTKLRFFLLAMGASVIRRKPTRFGTGLLFKLLGLVGAVWAVMRGRM